MYTVLFKKDLHSIVECLRKLGHLPNIYSEKRNKLGVLSDNKEELDVAVIDNINGIDYHSLPVNTNKDLPVSFPLMFLYEAEFTEQDIAYAEYSLLSLIDPDITHEEREEEMDFLREEFGIA